MNTGLCPKCQQSNAYSIPFCTFCGERLPWADALKNAASAQPASQQVSQSQPPVNIPNAESTDGSVWLLAFAPLLGWVLSSIVSLVFGGVYSDYYWITAICNFVLLSVDLTLLKKAGVDMSMVRKWALLVPVYLFLRANKLKQPPTYGWAWMAMFTISLFPAVAIAFATPKVDKEFIKTQMQARLNKILADGGTRVTCTDVAITDKADGNYEGLVTFSNGSTRTADITANSEGTISWHLRRK